MRTPPLEVRQWWRQQRSFAEIAALGRRNATGVWLYTHNGSNFADRFPRLVEAVKSLRARSCFIDGEAPGAEQSLRRRRSRGKRSAKLEPLWV
jgi:hypothetical protein